MTAPIIVYERGILNGTTEEPRQGIYETSETQKYVLGTVLKTEDGRSYRYAQAGGTALIAGNILTSAAIGGATTTAQTNLAIATSGVVGDPFGYATISTTTQPADTFRDGYYCVEATTAANGRGTMYKLASHGALTAASQKLNFADGETLRVATLAGTSTVRLVANPYKKLVQSAATTAVGAVMGGAPLAVTANYFFWCQTWGPFNALAAGAVTAGRTLLNSVAVAGAVSDNDAILDDQVVGYSTTSIADTENGPIFLTLAP